MSLGATDDNKQEPKMQYNPKRKKERKLGKKKKVDRVLVPRLRQKEEGDNNGNMGCIPVLSLFFLLFQEVR